jgi:hypothetical protein
MSTTRSPEAFESLPDLSPDPTAGATRFVALIGRLIAPPII